MYKLPPRFDIEENLFYKELFTMLQFSGEEDLYYPELPTRPVSSLLQANPALSRYYLKGAGSPFLQIFRQGGGLPNLKILEMGYLGFNISGVYLAFRIPIYPCIRSVPGLPAAAAQLPPAAAPEPSKRWNLRSVNRLLIKLLL